MPAQVEEQSVLTLGLDGDWTGWDFARLLDACNDIYNLHLLTFIRGKKDIYVRDSFSVNPLWQLYSFRDPFSWSPDALDSVTLHFNELPIPKLAVTRLHYGSPGSGAIGGLGSAMKALTDLFVTLLHWKEVKDKLAAEAEAQRLKNAMLKIKLLDAMMTLLEDAGFTKRERKLILQAVGERVEYLLELIRDGKITHVSVNGVKLSEPTEPTHNA